MTPAEMDALEAAAKKALAAGPTYLNFDRVLPPEWTVFLSFVGPGRILSLLTLARRAEAAEARVERLEGALIDLNSWMKSWSSLSIAVGREAEQAKDAIEFAAAVVEDRAHD